MKSMFLGGIAALALGVTGALAQSTAQPANPDKTPAATTAEPSKTPAAAAAEPSKTPAAAAAEPSKTPAATTAESAKAPATTAAAGDFITKQEVGTVRAPKLVGVAVYDTNNKSVGKIDDLLLDKNGAIKVVVIGVGGFLGIGKKDVALPYSAIQWQTEARTVAVNGSAPANGGTTGASNSAASQPATTKIDPAQQEAYQGYPDRAVIAMSQEQLKNAPEFKYASNPASTGDAMAPAKKP